MKFVSHLEKALCDKQIKVYMDEKTLEKGEEISPALLNAIKKSKISIIIFSENYASSTWCLDELVHILKCREESGQIVVPIFYGVDPSQVRKQEGSFAHAFVAHQQCFEDGAEKLQEWKTALTMASNISGWESRSRNESKLVEEIVEYVVRKVRQCTASDFEGQGRMNRQHQKSKSSTTSSYTSSRTKGEYCLKIEDLKGIKRHLERFEPLFDVGSRDVRILGIWGMGGIGKTTLAEVIFRIFSSRFEVRLFLAKIREKSKRFGLAYLEYKLFSELLKEESIDMADHSIKDRIRRKNVLLVLDDVDNSQQLERLARDRTWFGSGSRIIITTRNRHLLRCCCADAIYEVDGLNFDEALELFRFYASRGRSFIPGYAQLSQSVVHYAYGLPLALKLLGCSLYGKSRKVWESTLDKLKEVPVKEIYKVLRVSYDELDDMEKDIFLDIACFLRGRDTDFVARILEKFGSVARIGIAVLVDKSLISIKGDGEIYMHNSIRGMAWEIDRQSTKNRERNYWLSINKGIGAEGRHFDTSNIDHEELSLRRRVSEKRYESKSSEEIVEKVASKLSYASLRTTTSFNGLVGINRQLKKIESLFGVGSPDVRVLGIWGMGGIGKTTLARVIFNRSSSQFEGCCFLKNIREESRQRGLAYLEHKLFSELLKEEDVIRPWVKHKIQPKKVLIVLDDVDDLHQIERLARDHNWFGSESRLIITTRDRNLLRQFAVDEIYEVDGLNFDEAIELFCLNAFRGRPFISAYAQLSQSIVHYAHGIPLALKVLGSFLCGRSIREWESELNKLRCIPSNDIYKVLRVSYDELASTERDIFLEIARFLEGRNRDFVERKL